MSKNWENSAKQILEQVRGQIKEAAGENIDEWFKINRYVYARLQLDERKGKPKKTDLFDKQEGLCWICNERIDKIKETDTHRINEALGYDEPNNIVLVHRSCHQQAQSKQAQSGYSK